MRILFVTNYYPPAKDGWGYAQLCADVADRLCERGHSVAVLTSTYCDGPEMRRGYPVAREIHIDPDFAGRRPIPLQFFLGRKRREQQAIGILHRTVSHWQPDVIVGWYITGLSRALMREAEQMSDLAVAYYLAGYMPEVPDEYAVYWEAPAVRPLARPLKRLLGILARGALSREGKPLSLRYENAICVSDFLRNRLVSEELIPESAVVIRNGVDLAEFSPNAQRGISFKASALHCVISGRVVPEKGIHTAVDAMAELQGGVAHPEITLTILGDGPSDYLAFINKKIGHYGLGRCVEVRKPLPRQLMPATLSEFNTLILPSEWEEPLARSMQEAMAMGMLVIGTNTGGTGELLVDEETGLVFEAGNPHSLADQLSRAWREPDLVSVIANSAQRAVRDRFDIERMVDQLEDYLIALAKDSISYRLARETEVPLSVAEAL